MLLFTFAALFTSGVFQKAAGMMNEVAIVHMYVQGCCSHTLVAHIQYFWPNFKFNLQRQMTIPNGVELLLQSLVWKSSNADLLAI